MKKTFYLLMALLACTLWACSTDSGDTPDLPSNIVYDFATLESTNANGSVFTLRKSGDSPLIYYYSSYALEGNDDVKPGQRVIIGYVCLHHEPYTTGEIALYGIRLLNNTTDSVVGGYEQEYSQWASDDVDMQILTRTGQYVNMQMLVYSTNNMQMRQLSLVADSATIDDPYPQLHLICETANKGSNSYTAYASFDISSVWDLPTAKGVKVLYQTTNGVKSTSFDKANTSVTPME